MKMSAVSSLFVAILVLILAGAFPPSGIRIHSFETGIDNLDLVADFVASEGDLVTFYGYDYVVQDAQGIVFELLNVTLPEPRFYGEAVWIDDKVWIIGGLGKNRRSLDDIIVFDTKTYAMDRITTVPHCSKALAAAFWNGEYVYIFGGTRRTNYTGITLKEVLRFSPSNLSCESLPEGFQDYWQRGSIVWNGQYAYLFGYWDQSNDHDEIFRFDPDDENLTEEPFKLPSRAEGIAAIWLEDRAYLFGGDYRIVGKENLRDIVLFNPQVGADLTPAELPAPTGYASAVRVGEHIYVIGGHRMDIAGNYHYYDQVIRYSLGDGNVSVYSEKLPYATDTWNSLVWNGTAGFLFGGWDKKYARDEIVKITLGGMRTPLNFSWDFNDRLDSDGNGDFTDDVDASGPEVEHVFGDNGFYNVTLIISYSEGPPSVKTLLVEVKNVSPKIDRVQTPSSPSEGSTVSVSMLLNDPGSDDLTSTWDWGDGTIEAKTFYNNDVSPDPQNSPWGVFPFRKWNNGTHIYGDDGDFTLTTTVEDDDGGSMAHTTVISVQNVPPNIESAEYYLNASFFFRIAGEKWHNVEIYLYEDGTKVGYANITRYPGSPNDQMATLADVSIDFSKTYSAVAHYTPEDDPINGQILGANPAWVTIQYEDGEERIHHTFNVRHEDTWTWLIDDLSPYFLGHNITFVVTACDPGSDDLTFRWNWGDGNTTETVYYNDGIGPDPYPSPEVNPITITDAVEHSYASAGTYAIVLTVTDDDGGIGSYSFNLTL
ncbi:MAG: PKD domain-containing protein [Thermoplasmata archaeon]